MATIAIQTASAQSLTPTLSSPRPIPFAITLILAIGALVLAALGLCTYLRLGLFSQLSQVEGFILLIAGGGIAIPLLIAAIRVAARFKKAPEEKHPPPLFLFAPEGINQYGEGGVAACTRISCRFLALTPDGVATPESLQKAIQGHGYTDSDFEETEKVIRSFSEQLELVTSPWKEEQHTPEMQIDLYERTEYDLSRAVEAISESSAIDGALITGQMMTIALRKVGDNYELFDSHGSQEISGGKGNVAYLHRCDFRGVIAYLKKRFPRVDGMESIEQYSQLAFYPIRIKRT